MNWHLLCSQNKIVSFEYLDFWPMNLLFKIHWRYGFWAVLLEQHVSHNLSSAQTNQEGIKCKVEKIEEDSLDLIPSPPTSDENYWQKSLFEVIR